ncbi:MAG: hypothetical protein Q7S50_03690 [bacterium]|nr:hypothetical protein [bacterium]
MKGNRITRLPLFGAEVVVSVPRIGFRPEMLKVGNNNIVFIGSAFNDLLKTGRFRSQTSTATLVLAEVTTITPEFNCRHLPQKVRPVDLVDVVALTTDPGRPLAERGPHGIPVQGMGWLMTEHPEYAGVLRYWHPNRKIFIPSKGDVDYGPNPGWAFEALKRSEGEHCLSGMRFLFGWF